MYQFPANGKSPACWSAAARKLLAAGRVGCGWILGREDKRTMNLFAIDSLNEVREDTLGPGYDKPQK
jgi:hypothetical protein